MARRNNDSCHSCVEEQHPDFLIWQIDTGIAAADVCYLEPAET